MLGLLLTAYGKKPAPPPAAAHYNPEFPDRPSLQGITPAQRSFWDYLQSFHRLPDSSSGLQRLIFATRGEVKPFQIIATSPTSVFGDVDGIKAHRERFAQRYPWVKKLLETENITLDVDESVFRGSAQEVISKHYDKVDSPSGNYFQTGRDRRLFAKRWLETLLAVDFIFACGSAQDRKDGMALLEQTMTQAEDTGDTPERAQRGAELEIPAMFEIAMPIANEFPDDVPENLIRFMPHLITGKENATPYIDCLKWTLRWALRVKAFSKWENLLRYHEVEVGNQLVINGLLHEAVWWNHLHEKVRPDPGSSGLAVKALFKRIYGGNAWAAEHRKYHALLDAAYPPANQGSKPSSSKS